MFYLAPVEYNLADLFEHAVDVFGEREYLVANGVRRSYVEMEARANRLAHHLAGQGIGPGDHVGIYAYNRVEWVETLWAVFKLRAVWVNINYRYVADELHYLFSSSDVSAMVVDRRFAPLVAECRDALSQLRHLVVIDDGSESEEEGPGFGQLGLIGYEEALAPHSGERDFGPRSGDDRYILFTGGTTGLPKGVVWRHEDVLFALGGGIDPLSNARINEPEELARRALADNLAITFLPIAPLMHGATQWGVMGQSFKGNRVVLVDRFDPARVWRLVGELGVNLVMLTGDAMARPLIEEYEARALRGEAYDASSLFGLSSTAAVFSAEVKEAFLRQFPNLVMTDAIGSSESGANGIVVVRAGETAMRGGPTVTAVRDSVVLGADLRPMAPGTGEVGRLARTGNIPLGYYKDPEKTAEVFVEVESTRYVMTGDLAVLEADGSITLLGRGSVSINTGGEKVFPEEVEAAVKSHPDVYDATIVGVPDPRWGQRVAAVVQARHGRRPELESIQAHCRTRIAGYKVPRELHLVEEVVRSPAGKPDYRWALSVALGDRVAPVGATLSAAEVAAAVAGRAATEVP